ncbi:ester cyclase [Phaeobacter sp. HF9A]|uniref:ester cyclase n=1 Tax=Phaeobacter sp. HF9A TaxID=2721561 RepID=UPI0014315D87|nr:nuclear transport factor 2 family protein [Phaeobacter sp. HF9A]NIZ13872.1 ester cyclase [Phaeobacter sp. HF9A]
MTHSALLHLWFDEVWNNNNLDVVDDLLHPDVIFRGSLDSLVGPDIDYKEIVTAMKTLIEQLHVTITHSLESDEFAMVRVLVQAVDPVQNREFDFTGQVLVRVKDGKFIEFYSNFDYLRMFEQLGQLPVDAMPVFLTGERLTWVA